MSKTKTLHFKPILVPFALDNHVGEFKVNFKVESIEEHIHKLTVQAEPIFGFTGIQHSHVYGNLEALKETVDQYSQALKSFSFYLNDKYTQTFSENKTFESVTKQLKKLFDTITDSEEVDTCNQSINDLFTPIPEENMMVICNGEQAGVVSPFTISVGKLSGYLHEHYFGNRMGPGTYKETSRHLQPMAIWTNGQNGPCLLHLFRGYQTPNYLAEQQPVKSYLDEFSSLMTGETIDEVEEFMVQQAQSKEKLLASFNDLFAYPIHSDTDNPQELAETIKYGIKHAFKLLSEMYAVNTNTSSRMKMVLPHICVGIESSKTVNSGGDWVNLIHYGNKSSYKHRFNIRVYASKNTDAVLHLTPASNLTLLRGFDILEAKGECYNNNIPLLKLSDGQNTTILGLMFEVFYKLKTLIEETDEVVFDYPN